MRATPFNQAIVTTKQALDPRRLATLDDATLVQHLIDGDRAAFEAIMLRHGATVTAAARQILRDTADVEDVFQAAFIVLLKSATKIQQRRSLGSWLFGVAHRLAVHARSRNAKLQTRERTPANLPEPAAPADDLSWREATSLLHEELNRMPDRLRVPLLLCHLEGKSRDEAAAELGVSVGAIKGLLERGRAKLKERLEKRGIAFSVGLLGVLVADGAAPPTAWVDSTVNAVVGQAVRPAVQQLAQGVLPMSYVFKITLAASLLVVASVFGVVAYMYAGGATETSPPVTKDAPPPPKTPPKAMGEVFTVSGKVVGSDGKPLANVPLFIPVLLKDPPIAEADIGVKEITRSGADGTFRAEIKRTLVSRFLYAEQKERALAWTEIQDGQDRADIVMKLEQEMPITGRLLDTEGKPIVGATLRLQGVQRAAGAKLDDVLAEFKRNWQHALQSNTAPILTPSATQTTDKEGRFTLGGVPTECIASIAAESPTVGKVLFHVVTRAGFDPKPYNEAALNQVPVELRFPGQPATLYGPKAEVVFPLGRVIEGIVTDAATGKPVPGINILTGDHFAGQAQAISDKDGRYRLVGVRKHKQYLVHATTRNDPASRYMMWTGRLDDTEGYGPITHHIQLTEGVVVTGKLIDRGTGKGAFGYIRSAPLADNEHFAKNAGNQGYNGNRMANQVKPDGSFRLLLIPGKNIILAQAPGGTTPSRNTLRPYLNAKPDPDYAKLFTKNGDDYVIATAGNNTEFVTLNQAIKVIDIPAAAKEFTVDLYLERGQTQAIHVVDAAGKPVAKNVVCGAAGSFPFVHRIDASEFTAVALEPTEPRLLVVVNPERKLAGSVTLRGDAKGPVTVKLEPLATMSGRILDLDGLPRAGVTVAPRGRGQALSDLYREAFGVQTDVTTDAAGKFTLPLIIPNTDVFLSLRKDKEYYVGETNLGARNAEPGKNTDFGTIKTKVAP
jgi:RNA polymerase sigma factor (sigma-70 family)